MPERTPPEVSVAIPVRDGGPLFAGVLEALARQTVGHELLVCDSGSSDSSVALARAHGARVLEVEPPRFNHGATRNLLMDAAAGTHVALLTQDAEPADERWLERLLGGFELAGDVGLVYGPYRPRAHAAAPVRLELERWFGSLSPDGSPQVERLGERARPRCAAGGDARDGAQGDAGDAAQGEAGDGAQGDAGDAAGGDDPLAVVELVGRRGFFTDANACLSRAAWERAPFRAVPYAEDRVLAIDMLRAGYAKAFVPEAAVIHSHSYTAPQQLRRCFDEWRGLREVYGWREPASPAHLLAQLRGELAHARAQLHAEGASPARRRATLVAVLRHHLLCRAGALLGSRADRLPAAITRGLSLEGRAGFAALDLHSTPETQPPTPPPYR